MDPIEILYRSHDLLICVKPAGVLSQSGTSGQKSMISLLESQTGCRVYPVHRLDREVGGVMVYALSRTAAGNLSQQIQSGQMVKEYLAVTNGIPSQSEGLLTDLLFHDRVRNKTFVVDRKRKGVKEARLMYRVLQTSPSQSLIQVRLLTGRTHQIRVQFASRGTPLSGDARVNEIARMLGGDADSARKHAKEMLKGKDSKAVLQASIGTKATILYEIMENYDKARARKIQQMADYISSCLPKLKKLQDEAKK